MKRIPVVIVLLLLLSAAVAACGSSSSSSSSTGGSSSEAETTEAGGGSSFMAETEAAVEMYLSPKGTFQAPPSTAPKPQPGKHIALVSCGSTVIPSCGLEIEGAKEAAEAMGWTTTIIDAKEGDPTTTVSGIEHAVAEGVDGIFTYYIDCQYIKQPLEQAKQAGIPVVNADGQDCSETESGAPSLFTYTVRYNSGKGSFLEWIKEVFVAQAQYAVVKKEGKASVSFFTDNTSAAGQVAADAVKAYLEGCEECESQELLFPISDIGTNLQGKTETFFLKNQSVNAAIPAYSAILLGGLAAGAQGAGREILLSVAEGLPEGLDLIREEKAQYGYGLSYEWEGYAAIDSLNRIIDGQSPKVDSGIGVQLFDQEHNFPSGENWEPPFDFRALYRKAWGVEG
jgi:ribose transport system substrate-binding protein